MSVEAFSIKQIKILTYLLVLCLLTNLSSVHMPCYDRVDAVDRRVHHPPYRSQLALSCLFSSPQLPAVMKEVSLAISSVSRVTKRQGCSGLKDLASTLGPALGESVSGRRLIRRVLSHVPGRTWEGKEELLEALVVLCTVTKGIAVIPTPLVLVRVEDETGGSPGRSLSRDAKRYRIEPFEEGEDGKMMEVEEGQEHNVKQSAVNQKGIEEGCSALGVEPRSNAEEDGEEDALEGTEDAESAFQYEDKLGDLDNGVGEVPPPPQQQQPCLAAGDGFQKGVMLETKLESLYMEDDSPVSFGEVVALMLRQFQRLENG